MRFSPIAISLSLMLATVSSSGFSQKPDTQIDPRSVALAGQAASAMKAGKLDEATGFYESALAVDPRNRGAFIGLAEIARAQSLPGKAIRLYFSALAIDPSDVQALKGQGEAMVEKGAMERAKQNLARIKTICRVECAASTQLAAVIAKGPPIPAVTAQAAGEAPKAKPN